MKSGLRSLSKLTPLPTLNAGGLDSGRTIVVPNTFKEAMKLPEADKWREATKMEFYSLLMLGIFERIPLSKSLPGQICSALGGYSSLHPTGCVEDASLLFKVGVKFLGLTVVEPTLLSVDFRVFGCYLP